MRRDVEWVSARMKRSACSFRQPAKQLKLQLYVKIKLRLEMIVAGGLQHGVGFGRENESTEASG